MSLPALRRGVLLALVTVLAQAALGMVVNLYVKIPPSHPGAHPGDYFSGSLSSIGWAIGQGAAGLAIHAALGIAIVVAAILIAVGAVGAVRGRLGAPAAVCTITAALLVIGAGFNGASFLDFGRDVSSLVMALLAFGAALMYALALYLLPGPSQEGH